MRAQNAFQTRRQDADIPSDLKSLQRGMGQFLPHRRLSALMNTFLKMGSAVTAKRVAGLCVRSAQGTYPHRLPQPRDFRVNFVKLLIHNVNLPKFGKQGVGVSNRASVGTIYHGTYLLQKGGALGLQIGRTDI